MGRRHRRRPRATRGPRFAARHPSRLLEFIGPAQWAFMRRISTDIQAFEYEVLGNSEPSVLLVLIGATVSGQLWERHGSEAQWANLDVDAVLDRFCDAPPEVQAELHTTVAGARDLAGQQRASGRPLPLE